MPEPPDVVVVGAGPCGLLAAAALAGSGHSVVVLERHASPYGLPRAGHVDHEAVRILQGVRAHAELLEDATPYGDYSWFGVDGELLFTVDFGRVSESSWFTDYTMYQPTLETGLLRVLAETPDRVRIRYGQEVTGLHQDRHGVQVLARPSRHGSQPAALDDDRSPAVRGRYVVAADGANSTVRSLLGTARTDFGFSERWLIVDAEIIRRWPGESRGAQYCDWRRPAFETPLGRRHHRWEWQLLAGDALEDFEQPAAAWRLLAERGIGPEDVTLVRQQVYSFEARSAERWRAGRVLLAGDAAHTMPPFMGQGLCSGLRDVANLAWKLDLVLRGAAQPALLDTYEQERRPHAESWTRISVEAGQISCVTDPEAAAQRDIRLRAGPFALPAFPHLGGGLIAAGDSSGLSGRLVLQASLRQDGGTALFDDLVAPAFTLLTTDHLTHRAALALTAGTHPEVTVIHVGPDVPDLPDVGAVLVDPVGAYAAYFAAHDVVAVLVRPDRYVFGTASSLATLPDLLSAFRSAAATAGMTVSPGAAPGPPRDR